MSNMNSYKLNKDKTKLIYEHQDSYGGCYHEISIKTLLRVLKPVMKGASKREDKT